MQKNKTYRNRKYLDWMQGKDCQVRSPHCNNDTRTTCGAHADTQDYGKGGSLKADDCAAAICCHACHQWLHLSYGTAAGRERREADKRFYHDRGIIRTFTLALKEGFFK